MGACACFKKEFEAEIHIPETGGPTYEVAGVPRPSNLEADFLALMCALPIASAAVKVLAFVHCLE
jgi:hypothetical protein